MKEKFRNIFWFFGIFAIVVMLCTFDMDYQELWQNLRKAGVWFPAVILLWVFIYYLNVGLDVPHHGAYSLRRCQQGHLIGYSLCDDAYLFPFLVLAGIGGALRDF